MPALGRATCRLSKQMIVASAKFKVKDPTFPKKNGKDGTPKLPIDDLHHRWCGGTQRVFRTWTIIRCGDERWWFADFPE